MAKIVAEIGINHNGSMDEARHLISEAILAGADAVKFQMFFPEQLEPPGEMRSLLMKYVLSGRQLLELKDFAAGIEMFVTPFHALMADWVAEHFPIVKIASSCLRDSELLKAAGKAKEIYLSTGMSTVSDVGSAIDDLNTGSPITIMQCTSSYPTLLETVNLRAMPVLGDIFHCPFGLSYHGLSTAVPVAAVAMGAEVIEVHFTLDRHQDGPDHAASFTPNELRIMVNDIRDVEKALGNTRKRPMLCEHRAIEMRNRRDVWRER